MSATRTILCLSLVGIALAVSSPARSEMQTASREAKEPVTNRIAVNRLGANRLGANKLGLNKLGANRLAGNRIAVNGSQTAAPSAPGVPADGAVAGVAAVVLQDGTRLTR